MDYELNPTAITPTAVEIFIEVIKQKPSTLWIAEIYQIYMESNQRFQGYQQKKYVQLGLGNPKKAKTNTPGIHKSLTYAHTNPFHQISL